MDDRDRLGGLTGATGRLTPDDPDDAFVPAETREIADAEAARDVTAAAHRQEEHLPPPQGAPLGTPGGQTRIGGDEVRSPDDEHL